MPAFKNNLTRDEYARGVEKHPKAKRALCFGDSWFQYVPHPTDLNKQLARLFPNTLFLREGLAGRDSATWFCVIRFEIGVRSSWAMSAE